MHVRRWCVDAAEEFLSALRGVADPEEKRKIIGRLFVEVFQREAKKIRNASWLAQGTIYPDVIESAGARSGSSGKKATTIKSHHNVGGLPETLHLKLLEPLRELFKDGCAGSASRSACRARWCSAIPSRGPASAFASWVKSRRNTRSS
jgi:GMP synthase (glutamine-hydrolysing)